MLAHSPEVPDAVDRVVTSRKFMVDMLYPITLFIPVIHQPVVRPKASEQMTASASVLPRMMGVGSRMEEYPGVLPLPLLSGDLTRRTTTSFASHPTGSEVAFIEFHPAVFEGCFGFANLGDALAK